MGLNEIWSPKLLGVLREDGSTALLPRSLASRCVLSLAGEKVNDLILRGRSDAKTSGCFAVVVGLDALEVADRRAVVLAPGI
jgi:hypothetical protein